MFMILLRETRITALNPEPNGKTYRMIGNAPFVVPQRMILKKNPEI